MKKEKRNEFTDYVEERPKYRQKPMKLAKIAELPAKQKISPNKTEHIKY